MSFHQVVAVQLIEGGVDSSLFENFVYHTVTQLSKDPDSRRQHMVLLIDNASIHHQPLVLDTCRKLGVTVIFNAEYSPQLNPVE